MTVNQGTDTVQLRAVFSNPDRMLVDGQLVSVVAEVGKPQASLLIPQQAIQTDPFVLVVDQQGRNTPRRSGRGDRPARGARRSSSRVCRRCAQAKSCKQPK